MFYYNTYDLPSRYMREMETLYLHEGVPGHHFQISLAQEDPALPAFMRFGGNTAYVEGWGLYAESLWKELGMETDPYQRMGGLNDEMLRAMRLVVDSGIHAKGWTRDRAIEYMLANSPMAGQHRRHRRGRALHRHSRSGAGLQDRPAHHLERPRRRRRRRWARSSIRAAFHAQVLDTGALPHARAGEEDRRTGRRPAASKPPAYSTRPNGISRSATELGEAAVVATERLQHGGGRALHHPVDRRWGCGRARLDGERAG